LERSEKFTEGGGVALMVRDFDSQGFEVLAAGALFEGEDVEGMTPLKETFGPNQGGFFRAAETETVEEDEDFHFKEEKVFRIDEKREGRDPSSPACEIMRDYLVDG
jgi:hypothetical protein